MSSTGGRECRQEEASSTAKPATIATTTTTISIAVGKDQQPMDTVTNTELQAEQHSSTSVRGQESGSSPSKVPRTCRVCGDKAKSMHFGGLSCDSCKAFFRRAVHNDTFTNFTCPYDANCVINIASRKCCQFCRYKKCMAIGMERSWVMSEEDRSQMMKQRAEKRARIAEVTSRRSLKEGRRELLPYEPDLTSMLNHMTSAEWNEVEQTVKNYRRTCSDVSYCQDLGHGGEGRPGVQIINLFATVVRRFAYFAKLFPEFCDLPAQDQGSLLRYGILEMSLIRGVQSFDTKNNRWPDTHHQPCHDSPTWRLEDMKKLVSCELYEMHMKFIQSLKELNVDEPVMMLLLMVVLFTNDRPGLLAASTIQARQDHYLQLLRKYLGWRYGPHNAPLLYPRLLLKLTDLRELNDQHTEYNLKLAKQEIAEIQTQLGCLNLHPYTEWPSLLQAPESSPPPFTDSQGSSGIPRGDGSPSADVPMLLNLTHSSTATTTTTTSLAAGFGEEQNASPISSAILASLDLERLVNNPTVQRLIFHQFQRSVFNVLTSPSFSLASMLLEDKSVLTQQTSSTLTTTHKPSPATSQESSQANTDVSSFPSQKPTSQQTPHPESTFVPQQSISQGGHTSDLMTHLDYLNSSSPPQHSHNVQQSQQAFQQLEQQLMSNITMCGSFDECSQQQQQKQQQQQCHYQFLQQHQEEQQAIYDHHNHHHHNQEQHQIFHQQSLQLMAHQRNIPEEGLLVPKEEPQTPSSPILHTHPYPHSEYPHMHEDHHYYHPNSHHHLLPQQASYSEASGSHHRSNSLEEYPGPGHHHLQQVRQVLGPDLVVSLHKRFVTYEDKSLPHHHLPPPFAPPLSQQQPQQQQPLHHSPPLPQPQLHQMHSQPYTYTGNRGYQFYSEHMEDSTGSGSVSPITSYSPTSLEPSPPPPPLLPPHHYTTPDIAMYCNGQHRVTPNSTAATTITSPPQLPCFQTSTRVFYSHHPDFLHNATSLS